MTFVNTSSDWAQKRCKACSGADVKVFTEAEAAEELKALEGWQLADGHLRKTYRFENYYQTAAFVNAVVWISHHEDHHPDLHFDYKTCTVKYRTHKKNGITDNDFICAAKVERLLK